MLESMAAMAPGVGIILGGALTTLFSPRAAYLVAGLGLVALIRGGRAQPGRSSRSPAAARRQVTGSRRSGRAAEIPVARGRDGGR